MKNTLFLLAFFLFGSKLQAQSGLTFNRVVVIDTNLATSKASIYYSPPTGHVWKIESCMSSNNTIGRFWINSMWSNLIPNPSWIDEKSTLKFGNVGTGTTPVYIGVTILEFKVD